MNAPRFAKLAGSLLAQNSPARDSLPPPAVDAEKRALAIAAVERAIRARAEKKKRIRWIAGGLAMAASIAAIVGTSALLGKSTAPIAQKPPAASDISLALAHSTGDVSVSSPAGAAPTADGSSLAAGSHIVTKQGGHAVVALSTGTRLAIDETSDFSVVEGDATQIFQLAGGSMRADVAKLTPGQRFLIRTSDSEVEVHGTSFTVTVAPPDPACGGGTVTRVVVYEGVVSVRHDGVEARVPKGSEWPSGCNAQPDGTSDNEGTGAASNDSEVVELPDTPSHGASASNATPHVDHARPQAQSHSKKSSPLSEQNDIFESALTAERDGLVAGAISDYERYLSLYPNGPLAEHAAVRRMKLLRTVDPARAAAAAKDYLARYPSGFARGEAQAIVAEKH